MVSVVIQYHIELSFAVLYILYHTTLLHYLSVMLHFYYKCDVAFEWYCKHMHYCGNYLYINWWWITLSFHAYFTWLSESTYCFKLHSGSFQKQQLSQYNWCLRSARKNQNWSPATPSSGGWLPQSRDCLLFLHKNNISAAHINHFCVISRHFTLNLIVNLSHLPDFSINYEIPKELCSLTYSTVDTAFRVVPWLSSHWLTIFLV